MKKIKFDGYLLATASELLTEIIDVKKEVADDLNNGYGDCEEIYEQLENIYGEDVGGIIIDFNKYITVDEGSAKFETDECRLFDALRDNSISFVIPGEFDVEKFAKDHNLEEVEERDDR